MSPRDLLSGAELAVARESPLEVAREWRELWRRCPDATVFQSPDWLLPWLKQFGGESAEVITVRRAGQLVGLVALQTNGVNGTEAQEVCFVGGGVSDYLDLLVEPENGESAARALWRETHQWLGKAAVVFEPVPAWSPLLRFPPEPAAGFDVQPCDVCPAVTLRGSREARLPSGWRRKLDYERRRLERTGPVTFELATRDTRAELLAALFELHAARWTRRGAAGVLADPALRAFHEEASAALLDAGALRLYALRFDGRVVAVCHGFLHGRRACYYLGGFDPRMERYGVGNQVVDHAMSEAAREGAQVFDFLRGAEAYKYRWGALDQRTYRIVRARGS